MIVKFAVILVNNCILEEHYYLAQHLIRKCSYFFEYLVESLSQIGGYQYKDGANPPL